MARTDWRSASAYEDLRPLDAPAFAFEFLRRNPEFLDHHGRLMRKSRNRALEATDAEEFSQRWGVRFRPKLEFRPTRSRAVDTTSAPERGDPGANSRRPRRS